MALFKIFKGNETAKLTDSNATGYRVPTDGYAYYDTSTKLFYIDADYDGNGTIKRYPINAAGAWRLKNYNRLTDANIAHITDGGMELFQATATMTNNQPSGNGQILHFHWDTSSAWDSQLFIPNGHGGSMQWRAHTSATDWGAAWKTLIDNSNIGTYTTVSNTWTAGTTAGPTIKTTVNGVAGTAVAIPSASASASGVVTTGAQTFAGIKTFTNPETINTTGNGAAVNFKFSNAATANETYGQNWISYENTSGRFNWREWSGSSSGRTSYYEQYRLPACNASRTSNATYDILTSKNAVTIAQGGTSATTAGAAANNLLSGLPTWTVNPTDDTYFIRRDTAGSATFGQVKASTIYNYIKGKTDSVYAPISHNHYQLVTEGDNRTTATTPNSYNNNLVFRGLKTNSSFGSPSSDTYSYVVGLRGWQDASGGNAYELAFNNTGIYSRNGSTTSWNGWQRLATSSDLSSYVLKAGDTMSGTLHFKNITTGNYTEGIRLHPSSGGWNAITFCGTDNTGDSGTSTNTWGLFTHNGNFYIGKNGSNTAATFLRNVNGVWYWNGTAIGNASSANDISTGTPVLATATESNAITVIDLGNNVPATDQAQRHALDFKWYNSHWAIGNLRTGTSTSAGFGFSYSPDGTNWANKLIIGTNGSITIGHRETATSPSSATSSTRLTIIPYFHIGGPWTINSVDDSTNAYLTIKYGSSQITSLRHDGYMTAVRVYGAVWNDYAEYRKDNPNEIQEPGRCVRELGNGALALTTKRLERGCEIVSDTFGFAIGQDEKNGYNTPIASNGRVLAYPYESIEEFAVHIGWPVCSGPNGTVSIMTEEEEEKYPSRIIGTISEIPTYEEWGTGSVKVNGRVWIRIK